jgi:hypothetical protein
MGIIVTVTVRLRGISDRTTLSSVSWSDLLMHRVPVVCPVEAQPVSLCVRVARSRKAVDLPTLFLS